MQFLNIFVVRRRWNFRALFSSFCNSVSFLCNSTAVRGCRIAVGKEGSPSFVPLQQEGQNKTDSWGSNFHVMDKKSWSSCCLQTAGGFGSLPGGPEWGGSHECKVQEAERRFACWALKTSNPAISGCIDVSWWKECKTPVLTGLCHHMVRSFQRWIIIPWEQEIPRSECHWWCGNGIRL